MSDIVRDPYGNPLSRDKLITALRAENEMLRAALEMFACDCEGKAICFDNCMHRNARAALGDPENTNGD